MDLKQALASMNIANFSDLDRAARIWWQSLSSEDRKQLRQQFRKHTEDKDMRDFVDDSYEQLKEEIKHDDDS
jgi:hypothetical protein